MSKILRNESLINSVEILDAGVTVAPNSNYTIPPQDYPTFAASSDVIRALSDQTLILNDGNADVTVLSTAVDIIKGWFPTVPDLSTDFFFDYFGEPVGEGPHILFQYVVIPTAILSLSKVTATCRMESIWQILQNSVPIGELRTGASTPLANFSWPTSRQFQSGDLIEIILTRRSGSPDVSVGLYVQGITSPPTT